MATFEEHCKETVEKLGEPYVLVHQWLDALQGELGPEHRRVRHNIDGVDHCIREWGFMAGAAACIHIQRDEHSHVKDGDIWVPKPKASDLPKAFGKAMRDAGWVPGEHKHEFDADGGPCTICGKNYAQLMREK